MDNNNYKKILKDVSDIVYTDDCRTMRQMLPLNDTQKIDIIRKLLDTVYPRCPTLQLTPTVDEEQKRKKNTCNNNVHREQHKG